MKNISPTKNKCFALIGICLVTIVTTFLGLSLYKFQQEQQEQDDYVTISDLEHVFAPLQRKIEKQEYLIDNLKNNCFCCDHSEHEEGGDDYADDEVFEDYYYYDKEEEDKGGGGGGEQENNHDKYNDHYFGTALKTNENVEYSRQLLKLTEEHTEANKDYPSASERRRSKRSPSKKRSNYHHSGFQRTDASTTTNPLTVDEVLTRIELLEHITECISNDSNKDGVYFSGCNVYINNGEDESIAANSYGNLVIGHYNNETTLASSSTTTSRRDLVEAHDTGCSHNIILGTENACTSNSYGGIVGGKNNTLAGAYTSVLGGEHNIASGYSSTITGGRSNTVEGKDSSILGGNNNTVSGEFSSIAGGEHNTAASTCSSIIGGHDEVTTSHTEIEPCDDSFNAIANKLSCVRDGSSAAEFVFEGCNVLIQNNQNSTEIIDGTGNLIVGHNEGTGTRNGSHNIIVGSKHEYTSYGGFVAGTENSISGPYACISGGRNNEVSGTFSSILGGFDNQVMGEGTCVSGGKGNIATNTCASISGGENNNATERCASVSGGYEGVAGSSWSSVIGGNANNANVEYGIAPLICRGCKEIECDDGDLCTIDEIIKENGKFICKHTLKSCPSGESCDLYDGECKGDNDLVPCVAVIDEDDGFGYPNQEDRWTEFRTKYPTRPFCLLDVYPTGSVTIPPNFKSDNNTRTVLITRDEGSKTNTATWATVDEFIDQARTCMPHRGHLLSRNRSVSSIFQTSFDISCFDGFQIAHLH